jgi:hypothetical protein
MDGIAGVQARIQDILTQFDGPPAALDSNTAGPSTALDPGQTDFASALAQAQSSGAALPSSTMPTSTGTPNRAGVDPVQWAKDFLTRLNAPITASNVRAITAWEQAEGTAAAYNPLATTQSGYAGETRFNSVGVKNYSSYADGLDANVKAITNGLYGNILGALQQGNDADAVARAIAGSRWGTGGLVEKILSAQSG